jgi:hypothetical protein
MAEDARRLWIEGEYEDGAEIPEPSYPEEYSGKFNLRLPKSLHRQLAEAAEEDGVSLNQYVITLLARHDAIARLEHKLERVSRQVAAIDQRLRYQVHGVPAEARPAPAVRRLAAVAA